MIKYVDFSMFYASLLAMDIYHKLCIQLKWNTFTVSIGFFCIHTVYTFPWMPIKPLIIDSVSSMHSIKLAFLVIEAHCTNTHTHTLGRSSFRSVLFKLH